MNEHKNDLLKLKSEKEFLQEKLKSRTKEVREGLLEELVKVEEDMKKHFNTRVKCIVLKCQQLMFIL